MHGLNVIIVNNQTAAADAAQRNRTPLTIEEEDLARWREQYFGGTEKFPGIPFPVLGTHVPIGWEQTGYVIAISNPPTPEDIGRMLRIRLNAGQSYGIIEAGYSGIRVAEYKRVAEQPRTVMAGERQTAEKVEQPVEQPVETKVEQPVEQPVETKVEQPVETGAEASQHNPVEAHTYTGPTLTQGQIDRSHNWDIESR